MPVMTCATGLLGIREVARKCYQARMGHFLGVAPGVACMAYRAVNGMKDLLAICLFFMAVNAALTTAGRNKGGDEKQ